MLAGSSLYIRNALDAPIATTKTEHPLPANPNKRKHGTLHLSLSTPLRRGAQQPHAKRSLSKSLRCLPLLSSRRNKHGKLLPSFGAPPSPPFH